MKRGDFLLLFIIKIIICGITVIQGKKVSGSSPAAAARGSHFWQLQGSLSGRGMSLSPWLTATLKHTARYSVVHHP